MEWILILIKDFYWTGLTGFFICFERDGFFFYFPGFPEESLESRSPSASTNKMYLLA